MYISTNEGQTFNKQSFSPSSINPRTLKFHPTKESWFLAHDRQTHTVRVVCLFIYLLYFVFSCMCLKILEQVSLKYLKM